MVDSYEEPVEQSVMAPGWLSNRLRAITPLRTVVRQARHAIEPYRARTWTLQGPVATLSQPLRLIYAGQLESKNYLRHLAFQESVDERARNMRWLGHALGWRVEDNDADLIAIDLDRSIYRQYCGIEESQPEAGIFCIPTWIRGNIDVSAAARCRKLPETVRSDLRLIARNRLEYRLTRERAQFDRFYHSMYVPYIRHVYGDRAFMMSYDEMLEQLPISELILVRQDNDDIAGQIIVHRDGVAIGWSVGVNNGDPTFVKAGALTALYHFVPQYLAEQGYPSFDVGLSRPFLNDGVLRFKGKWGMYVTSGHDKLLILKFARTSAAAHTFMHRNPFIYLADGQLYGAIFITPGEENHRPTLERLRRSYSMRGLRCLNLFALTEVPPGLRWVGSLDDVRTT
ncbi:MAG: GNAT family N-acetyltransferase [Gammaproteobacteria bacterium]|nr:GNAT family N-acetyltransferase [Gammaproteobacteria bacterium]